MPQKPVKKPLRPVRVGMTAVNFIVDRDLELGEEVWILVGAEVVAKVEEQGRSTYKLRPVDADFARFV